MPDKKLAIVIPAFKAAYFDETLASIARQSDTRFTLYIGDDASAEDLYSIAEKYKGELEIVYTRFQQNYGGKSLVKQWSRCIDLCHEEWIWVFGDDDIMPKDAVRQFYQHLETSDKFDVVRFNLAVIDHGGDVLYDSTNHPAIESSYEFAARVLSRTCRSSASEFVFSRDIFQTTGGFVDFPLGWASDCATWIKFGMEKGIHTIEGEPVLWRLSGNNLSSQRGGTAWLRKIDGCIGFAHFLKRHFQFKDEALLDWMHFHFSLIAKGQQKLNIKVMHIRFLSRVAWSRSVAMPVIFKFYKERKLNYLRRQFHSLRHS